MKRLMAASALAVGLGVTLAIPAQADNGDGAYLSCLNVGWGAPTTNVYGSLNWGHIIRDAIHDGGFAPVTVRDYVYLHSDVGSIAGANVMVNCATSAYLGYGPPLT